MQQGVKDILMTIDLLQMDGAKHILVPGLSIWLSRRLILAIPPQPASAPPLSIWDCRRHRRLIAAGRHNPGAYRFTNVMQPCLVGLTPLSNPNQYLFWDDIHPTTAADQILAARFANVVSEPSTLLMVGTSVAGIAGLLRRRVSS